MRGKDRPCDVVIVGLGATGAVAASVLVDAGAEVVAIEAGPWRSPAEMTLDEVRNDVFRWLEAGEAVDATPTWRTDATCDAGPSPWRLTMPRAVGGGTLHYGALTPRLMPWNFQSRSEVLRRYGESAIPEGSTLADWPLTYDDLEPYYDKAEHAIGVAGTRASVGSEVSGDPFEGPYRSEYPMPPIRQTGWTELTAGAARRLGWHPFPAPTAINSVPYHGRPACTYCGFCDNNGCHADAKNSADRAFVTSALQHGNFTIKTEARATEIVVDGEGLASGVRYVQGGIGRFQPARVVLVGAFPYENTRLLLTSKSVPFPNGLANKAGQVGLHYIAHASPHVYGYFPGKDLKLFTGNRGQSTCVTDWNADNFDHTNLGFLGGGMIQTAGEFKPIRFASSAVPPGVPRWGRSWKAWLVEHAPSVGMTTVQVDCLPYETNYLDLDPVHKDRYGVPLVRVTHALQSNEERACDFLLEKMKVWLQEAGATEVWSSGERRVEPRHCYGGTRMGTDPATSVTDPWTFAHEVPNLGLMGASNFPSAGGANPTLTAQALTWRMADHLVTHWESRAR